MDSQHKAGEDFLVAAGSPPTLSFKAQGVAFCRVAGYAEIKETLLHSSFGAL